MVRDLMDADANMASAEVGADQGLDALIVAGIARVVIGHRDPDRRTSYNFV